MKPKDVIAACEKSKLFAAAFDKLTKENIQGHMPPWLALINTIRELEHEVGNRPALVSLVAMTLSLYGNAMVAQEKNGLFRQAMANVGINIVEIDSAVFADKTEEERVALLHGILERQFQTNKTH